MSSTRSYDLSIISDQEAADRLGMRAAEAEELFVELPDAAAELNIRKLRGTWNNPDQTYVFAANRASIALDILALRKAQVLLSDRAAQSAFDAGLDVEKFYDLYPEPKP